MFILALWGGRDLIVYPSTVELWGVSLYSSSVTWWGVVIELLQSAGVWLFILASKVSIDSVKRMELRLYSGILALRD